MSGIDYPFDFEIHEQDAVTNPPADHYVWRVLMVDDDEDDYLLTREMLANTRSDRFILEWVSSYDKGKIALLCGEYDAALIDYQMGDQNGVELIQELTLAGCPVPAILYTAYGGLNIDLAAMQAGAVDYLDKNQTTAALLEKAIRYAVKARQSEENLRRNEERYRLLFETMLQGVVYQDRDGKIISMNPAAQNILGKSPEDFLGSTSVDQEWHTLRSDGTPFPGMEHPAMVSLRTGQEVQGVVMGVYNPREKGYRWIMISAVPLFQPGEKTPFQVYTLFEDITQRRRAQQELRESEERYRSLIELSPDAIVVQVGGRFEFVNQAGLSLFGAQRPDQLLGQPVLERFARENRTQVAGRIRTVNEDRQKVPLLEEKVVRLDGGILDVEVVAAPYIYKGLSGALVVIRDITQRKKIENALRESETHFRLALSNAPITVFEMDRDLKYTWIYNPTPGFDVANTVGKTDAQLLGEENSTELTAVKQAVIDSGQGVRSEISLLENGYTSIYDCIFEPILENGQAVGLTGAMMDVTTLRQLKAEQGAHQARIEVQRRLIEQREQERLLIARDLHDGPLQELIGLSYMMEAALYEKDRAALDRILHEAEDLLRRQINELRSYASELRPPMLVSFGLEKAIRAHIKEFTARHPEIEVEFQAEQHGPLLGDTPRLALYRIYQELMNNIVKHARATYVQIRFYKTEEQAWLEVQDNGQGFSVPSDWLVLARQKHLGLVGIQERSEAVGGSVHITSLPGRGTTVHVTVPLNTPEVLDHLIQS